MNYKSIRWYSSHIIKLIKGPASLYWFIVLSYFHKWTTVILYKGARPTLIYYSSLLPEVGMASEQIFSFLAPFVYPFRLMRTWMPWAWTRSAALPAFGSCKKDNHFIQIRLLLLVVVYLRKINEVIHFLHIGPKLRAVARRQCVAENLAHKFHYYVYKICVFLFFTSTRHRLWLDGTLCIKWDVGWLQKSDDMYPILWRPPDAFKSTGYLCGFL